MKNGVIKALGIFNKIAPVWSADGAKIELAAPGVNIYSTWLNCSYANASGTSMAAPFVSGVVALVTLGKLFTPAIMANLHNSKGIWL